MEKMILHAWARNRKQIVRWHSLNTAKYKMNTFLQFNIYLEYILMYKNQNVDYFQHQNYKLAT